MAVISAAAGRACAVWIEHALALALHVGQTYWLLGMLRGACSVDPLTMVLHCGTDNGFALWHCRSDNGFALWH